MAHHRDAVRHQGASDLVKPAFNLDRVSAAFGHQPARVVQRNVDTAVTHERHVGDQVWRRQAAPDRPRVVDDVVDSDWQRR